MSLIFDTLVWKDEKGFIPWLADSWETSPDGLTWTFTLHPGVLWQDGQPLTAEDVAFTYAYFQKHTTAFKWCASLQDVDTIKAQDQQTVIITLKKPLAGFLADVAGTVPIIPKHIWEKVQDPAKFTSPEAVIGSGPFKLVQYSKEEGRYIYEANPSFFKGKPIIDRLVFVKVQDSALALKTGTVDAATFWGKEIEAVQKLLQEEGLRSVEGPSFWVLQLIFNTSKSPLDQPAFRHAIAQAIDRQKIVEQVTHGGAIVANLGIISPKTEWYNPNLPTYKYDPSKAREALQSLGLVGAKFTLLTTESFAREAELIKADLEKAGLQIEIKTGDRSTVDGLLRENAFDLAINGHGGIANPSILDNPVWPASCYHNERYNELFAAQAQAVNTEERKKLVWQLQELLAEDLPVLTLYHPKMWCLYNPQVLDSWFYTAGGVDGGIPLPLNKLVFLAR